MTERSGLKHELQELTQGIQDMLAVVRAQHVHHDQGGGVYFCDLCQAVWWTDEPPLHARECALIYDNVTAEYQQLIDRIKK
jgi:hypothetical protein